MADPIVYTAAEIAAQKAAFLARKGARSITFADQSVTFEPADDTLKTIATMRGSLTRYAATSKGV